MHTAIPRNNDSAGSNSNPTDPSQLTFSDLLTGIVFTASFHFVYIEQGGSGGQSQPGTLRDAR
jgi:hypothetical protein